MDRSKHCEPFKKTRPLENIGGAGTRYDRTLMIRIRKLLKGWPFSSV